MGLEPGAALGPYEILSSLGAGGMGEVYRARDTRLGRTVAVKVLPVEFASSPDRLRRFEQEARAAALLDHPNILAVHDVGSHEGIPYVVSELLEGRTLRERLAHAALPVRKAVEYASQIAHGLAAAHEKGIVHRDLKPENLFITQDGRAKVLDFGLARLDRPEGGGAAVAEGPTMTRHTEAGVVLGTVGYMSPEQVRGQPADHRSDIFALGAILCEMVSGRRAFRGSSAVETMNAILTTDPLEAWGADRPLPPGLERIVRHCLEKDPNERFQSARDLAFDLDVLSGSGATAAVPAAMPTRRRVRGGVVALVLLALIGAGAFLLGRSAAPKAQPSFRRLTFRRQTIDTARFTPDGRSVVYSAARAGSLPELFITDVNTLETRPLGVSGGRVLGTAPGEVAVGFREGWKLTRVPLGGGAPREVAAGIYGGDWGPKGGDFLLVRHVEGLSRMEYPPGKVVYQTADDIDEPRLSPGGERIAFIERPQGFIGGHVALLELGGSARRLSSSWDGILGLAWSPDGREIWFTASEPAEGLQVRAVSLSGRERLIAATVGALLLADVSRDGRALLLHSVPRFEAAGRRPGEPRERDLSWLDRSYVEDISPDGSLFLFHEGGQGGKAGGSRDGLAFFGRTDGSPPVRLGEGIPFALSPDGQRVLIARQDPEERYSRLVLTPTGASQPRPMPAGPIAEYYDAWWFPEGNRILIAGSERDRPRRMFVQELPEGPPRAVTPEGIWTADNTLSPDGQQVAATRTQPGALYSLYPVGGGEARPIPGLEAEDRVLRWSADGGHLFVQTAASRLSLPAQVVRLDLRTGRRQTWLSLQPADPAGVTTVVFICLSPDGRSYVYTFRRELSDLYLAEGLR